MDRITKAHRSWNMSRIRGKNTKPEITARKYLYGMGLRYRVHTDLPGKPDISIKRIKTAVFINGCFWHGHESCKYAVIPKSNTAFWQKKITDTKVRDKNNELVLTNAGWKIITIWECELKKDKEKILNKLFVELKFRLNSTNR